MLDLRLKDVKQERLNIIRNLQVVIQSITRMEATIADLRKTLSPINDMPNEILYNIFSRACSYLNPRYETPAPLILGSVCSRWRSLMLADASLWENINVYMSCVESGRLFQYKYQILCFLERGERSQQSLTLWSWTPARHLLVQDLFDTDNDTLFRIPFKNLCIVPEQSFDTTSNLGYLQANNVSIFHSSGSIQGFVPIMRYANGLFIQGSPPDWGGLPWPNLRMVTLVTTVVDTGSSNEILRNTLRDILHAAPYMTELRLRFNINISNPQPIQLITISHSNFECIRINLNNFCFNGVPFGIQLNAPNLTKVGFYDLKRQILA